MAVTSMSNVAEAVGELNDIYRIICNNPNRGVSPASLSVLVIDSITNSAAAKEHRTNCHNSN